MRASYLFPDPPEPSREIRGNLGGLALTKTSIRKNCDLSVSEREG